MKSVTFSRTAVVIALGLNSSLAFARDKFFHCTHDKVEYLVGGAVENRTEKWCTKISTNDRSRAIDTKNTKNESIKQTKNSSSTYKFDDVGRKEILFQELIKEQSAITRQTSLPSSQENSEIINRHKRNIESINAEIKRM
jgi:hypothetical protein